MKQPTPPDRVLLSVQFPTPVVEAIKLAAQADFRTVSAYIRAVVMQQLVADNFWQSAEEEDKNPVDEKEIAA